MAPSKKSKSVNKKFSYISEVNSSKEGKNANKGRELASPSKQKKRKLTDLLGPQWSKGELEQFYDAYRAHGKDWKKVAAAVRNRSVQMVEALYTMNRAYLSLPEGTASVIGLIAMMTDHYSVLEGSGSEGESKEHREEIRNPQKRMGGKYQENTQRVGSEHIPDNSQAYPAATGLGFLSLLKQNDSGIKPHAVRKRTPRIPVSYSNKGNERKLFSLARQGIKLLSDTNGVAPRITQNLTHASRKGDPSQNSRTPNKKARGTVPSGSQNAEKSDQFTAADRKFHKGSLDEESPKLSLGRTEGDNKVGSRKRSKLKIRVNSGTQHKSNRYQQRKTDMGGTVKPHSNAIKEAYSGTGEGQKLGIVKKHDNAEVMNAEVDGDSKFDALQTLADLSLMMPIVDMEPSPQLNEFDVVDESKGSESNASTEIRDSCSKTSKRGRLPLDNKAAVLEAKVGADQLDTGTTRKQKCLPFRISNDDDHLCSHSGGSCKNEGMDEVKSLTKGKRSSLSTSYPKHVKKVKVPAETSSTTNQREVDSPASSANQVNLVSKRRIKRKMDRPKQIFGATVNGQKCNKSTPSLEHGVPSIKEVLSNHLSFPQVRRWCIFEWFYSAIDYPWFAKREFMEYLDYVGLGHVSKLARIEWGVIRSSLGKPRRFSERFQMEEKEKLNLYRESVRTHYAELMAGFREGLPNDLARPLLVGQRVTAIHPKTREIREGSILTVDQYRYRVQFDQPELGVEYVMDIDCMPVNPLENMPDSLLRRYVTAGKLYDYFIESKPNGQLKEEKIEESKKPTSNESLEKICGPSLTASTHCINGMLKQLQAKVEDFEADKNEVVSQPTIFTQIHAKNDDVLALSKLNRALNKKEVVLSELKQMNNEVMERQQIGDNSFEDSESFKRHYAAVLLQLSDTNDQVSSALLFLRQRNTYRGSSPVLSKAIAKSDDPSLQLGSFNRSASHACSTLSHIAEIVDSSTAKARKMVDSALQAISSFKKVDKKTERIEEAIDFVSNRLSSNDSCASEMNSMPLDSSHVVQASQDHLASGTSNQFAIGQAYDPKSNSYMDQTEIQIPTELIAHCLATLLMIQKCTERKFPPSEVAQLLDYAVTNLQPICSKNLPIYAEIQKCMGIVRNQILALVPS